MPRAQGMAGPVRSYLSVFLGALVASVVLFGSPGGAAAAPPTPAPVIQVTSPWGQETHGVGYYLAVQWQAGWVGSGEFGVWVETPTGSRYEETIVRPQSDRTTTYLTLKVPAGSGYRAYVAWRPTQGSGDWVDPVPSPGTFTITDVPDATPVITITGPSGIGTYKQATKLAASWTTRARTRSGEFSAWVQGPDGIRESVTLVAANGGSTYETVLPLTMPVGDGYRVYVAWRPAVGSGDWYGTTASKASFSVVGAGAFGGPPIIVTAPVGTPTYAVGAPLTVSWTTASGFTDGEFGIWLDRGTGTAFLLTTMAPDGSERYSTTLTLDVPTGSGYRASVAWRPTGSADWRTGDQSAGVVTVKGKPGSGTAFTSFSFQGLTPPAVGQIYAPGRQITVTVPQGTDVRALVATFTTTGTSVRANGSVQVSGQTPNDFTNRVQYTVTSDWGSKQNWSVLVRTSGPTVGDAYGGGVVAYILQPGDPGYVLGETHGLIAAPLDQGGRVPWALPDHARQAVPGGTGTALGTGDANTARILAQNGPGIGYAAGVARAYRGGGYSDWYLPSKDELHMLALNQLRIGGFVASSPADLGAYWSSSEGPSAWFALEEVVTTRTQGTVTKDGSGPTGLAHVRPVRRF